MTVKNHLDVKVHFCNICQKENIKVYAFKLESGYVQFCGCCLSSVLEKALKIIGTDLIMNIIKEVKG